MNRKYFKSKSTRLSKSCALRYNRVDKVLQNIEAGKENLKGMNAFEVYVFFIPFFEDAIGYKRAEFTDQENKDLEEFQNVVYRIIGPETNMNPNLSALPSMKDDKGNEIQICGRCNGCGEIDSPTGERDTDGTTKPVQCPDCEGRGAKEHHRVNGKWVKVEEEKTTETKHTPGRPYRR